MAAGGTIRVWVPELFWPEPDDLETVRELRCPHLEKCLNRTPWQRMAAVPHEALLARLMGYAPSISLATLRARGETDHIDAEACLCADPVHLRFHHEQIVLADASVLDLQDGEVCQLVADLNRDFSALGEFVAAHPRRWYLKLADAHIGLRADLPTRAEVTGRRLIGERLHEMPTTPDQALIRHWQNEIQMWLHQHPVNEARLERGQPLLNGLWFWGTGQDFQPAYAPQVVGGPDSDLGVLLRGAARQAGSQWFDTASAMLQSADTLLLDDRLLEPVLYEDGVAWRAALEEFDRDVLEPLLASRRPVELWTTGVHGVFSWDLSQYRPWAFWKPIHRYAETLQALAAA